MLYEKRYTKKEIFHIFSFIDWALILPENMAAGKKIQFFKFKMVSRA